MRRLSCYFLLSLLLLRCALLAQPAPEAVPAPPEPAPDVIKLQKTDIEPPPAEPAEAPVKKRRRAKPAEGRFQPNNHSNAIFGQNVVVNTNESVRELVLIGGSAVIDGTVERDLVVIGGKAIIKGTVEGQVVMIGSALECSGEVARHTKAILSRATIADGARLGGGGFFLGGPFKISPAAHINGERVIIPFGDVVPKIEGLKAWLTEGLIWGRLLPMGVRWAWLVAGFFAGLYLLTLMLFPAAVKAVFLALEERPVTSVLSGFLTLILFAPLGAILVIAVIGIPVVPFLQVALVLSILFGKAAVMCFLGRSFGRSAGLGFLQTPLAGFLVGAALLTLAYMIPIFGVLAWALATVFGLGGSVVALARTFKREEGSVPPALVMVGVRAAPPVVSPVNPGGMPENTPPPLSIPAAVVPGDTLLLPRAGFWKRLLAALLDLLLLSLLTPVLQRGIIPVAVAYFVLMWTWKGTTIGSTLLRLKVVRTDGSPVSFSVALVRSLSCFFSAIVFFLGFLWTGWDREKQAWHDKIAGTVVVKMPRGFALL